MNSSNENDVKNLPIICPYCNGTILAHSISICPYCNAKVLTNIPVLDLFIYTDFQFASPAIVLKRRLSKKPDTESYIKLLLVNSLKRRPILSRVIITKPRLEVETELVNNGFLTNEDIEIINRG